MVSGKSPDWLPAGWIEQVKVKNGRKIKCYIDPLTGGKFYSKPQVSEYLRTVKHESCTSQQKIMGVASVSPNMGEFTGGESSPKLEGSQNVKILKRTSYASKQKQVGFRKKFVAKVVIERFTPEGLPPGWIKEIKIQKKANGIRKDPYYTDPVSGYVFRSQKDALRYLETGDFNRCAIKPKKRDELGFLNEENSASLPPAAIMQKLGHHTTRRQLFAGTENPVSRSLVTIVAEEGSEKRQTTVSADAMTTLSPAAEILKRKHSIDNVIDYYADTKESYDPSSSALPRTESKQGKIECAEDGTVSTPSTEISRGEKREENDMEKNNNRKTQIGYSKSKSKKALRLPCRSSKRLAGLKPEMVANLGLSEHALRAAARKCGESEAKQSLRALDNVNHSASRQFHTGLETEIADHALRGTEAPSNVELLNRSKKPLEHQAASENQPVRQATEKDEENLESQLICPFGDSWSDPCLEFAFKTLIGAIPVEDDLAIQGYLQQQVDTSHAQTDGCLALPEFGVPTFFQSDISSNFDATGKTVAVPQLPTNPTFLPPGNVSLPSCSAGSTQPPNLAGNKEHRAKVDS